VVAPFIWDKKAAVDNSAIAQMAKARADRRWPACVKAGADGLSAAGKVAGWVALATLNCALNQIEAATKDPGLSESTLQKMWSLPGNTSLGASGKWAKDVRQAIVRYRLAILTKVKSKPSWTQVTALMRVKDDLARDDYAKVLAKAGDLSVAEKQNAAAESFYHQSLFLSENAEVRKDLTNTRATLAPAKVVADKTEKSDKAEKAGEKPSSEKTDADEVAPSSGADATDVEIALDLRIQQEVKQGQWVQAAEDIVKMTQDFPWGRRAQSSADRISDIYSSLQLKKDPAARTTIEQVTKVLLKAPLARLSDWSKYTHRICEYATAFQFADKVCDSPANCSAAVLWVKGRSAEFTGNFKQAEESFRELIDKAAGTTEATESLYRLGLISIRQGKYPIAVDSFDKLLRWNGIDRYELNSHYWLARALEKTGAPRAATEKQFIIDRYPFSYYGLKLRAEGQGQTLTWPKLSPPAAGKAYSVWLAPAQTESWARFVALSHVGLFDFAQKEIEDFPWPMNPVDKIIWAQQMRSSLQFPLAIKLVNDAMEEDPELRRLDSVQISFPQEFNALIEASALKTGLAPALVKSLIRQESAFRFNALSSSNAAGLMQLIWPTAQDVARQLGYKNFKEKELMNDPETNIAFGTAYLARVAQQFQRNIPLALASYNAGPHKVDRWISWRTDLQELPTKIPAGFEDELWYDELPWAETSFYVKAILRNVLIYQSLDQRPVAAGPAFWQDLIMPGN
jgi:soluble lytic murein transglycosylase